MCIHASDQSNNSQDVLNVLKQKRIILEQSVKMREILQAPVCDCCGDCGIRHADVTTCINCCSSWGTGALTWHLSTEAHPFTQLFNTLAGCSAGAYAVGPMLQEWYIAYLVGNAGNKKDSSAKED